jgi:small subunit ribosomal protein S21
MSKNNTIPKEFDFSYFSPIEVKVHNNFDKALKTFRALVQSEKILSLYKEKQSYEKPSEKRRRKQNEALKRAFDVEMKQKKILSGEYEKEKTKKLARKEAKRKEREAEGNGQE